MKFYRIIFFFIFLLYSTFSQAQYYKFSADENEFGKEVKKLFNDTKVNDVIQKGNEFEAVWMSGVLSDEQRKKVIEISQLMMDKRYKVSPHLTNFTSLINSAIKIKQVSSNELDDILSVTSKALKKYEVKDFAEYLVAINNFLKKDAIYYTNFNKVYAIGGSYKFEFVENEEVPLPVVESETWEESAKEEIKNEDGWFSDWDSNTSDWNTNEKEPWANNKITPSETDNEENYIEKFLKGNYTQPEITGATIRVDNANLYLVSTYDSVQIKNTSGSLLIKNFLFVGNGGIFDWTIAGLNSDSVFVKLKEYSFKVTKPEISAENVQLTYIGKLKEPIAGVFEFKSKKREKNKEFQFPRFKSYSSKISVDMIGSRDLSFTGGFSLAANIINSSSVLDGLSTIEVREKGVKKFKARSTRFVFRDSIIASNISSIVLYQNSDSIYHPGISLKYNKDSKSLKLIKDKGWYKHTSFMASYYNMEFDADMLRWPLKGDSIDISILGGRHQIPAVFESVEYYDSKQFDKLNGLYNFHPLLVISGYSKKNNISEFYVADLAQSLKMNVNTLKGAMRTLMQEGFVDFNYFTGLVKIKRKAYHYLLSNSNKKDFDNLMIPSISPNKPNATINLSNNELTVRGIEKFYISESLDVYIKPTNQEIRILKDRNFIFDGRINAGSFEYIGKDFEFRYDSFLVALNNIDSIKFHLANKKNKKVKNEIENQLVETSGTLYINKPDNKAAKIVYPQYPYFSASKGATVYFTGKEILKGAYDHSIYFTIPPFEIDSLSSSDPSAISFNGTFHSGGILPPFKEKLVVMEDNSLGFVHKIPDSYNLYEGSAKMESTLRMDNKGLRANGKIDYLTSTLSSGDFILYMDSVTSSNTKADIREGEMGNVNFPQASISNAKVRWLPKKDSLQLYSLKEPFQFYNNTATLLGTTIVTSNGAFGRGKISTRGSDVISRDLSFSKDNFSARHARLDVKSDNPKKPALFGRDVRLYFDLVKNIANISPEVEGIAAMDFPYAQVKTSISNATWDLEKQTVKMIKPKDVDISKSYFYTTRKEQDSIAFNATEAIYDIKEYKLNVSGIPFIKVADAKITPDNNEVTILENANILPFKKATIVMDTLNEYHHLFDGNIKILSRNKFEGDATYRFVSAESDTFNIKFGTFEFKEETDKKGVLNKQTVASGNVTESDKLEISPGMIFKGIVTMYASKQALDVDGYVKLDFKTFPNYETWIKYKSSSEKQDVLIKFEDSIDEDGEKLNAGLHYESGTNNLYSSFVTPRKTIADEDFFMAGGILIYDQEKDEYKIHSPEKSNGKSFKGKFLSFNENTGDVKFEGPVNFIKSNKDFSITAAVRGSGNISKAEYSINTFMLINMKLPYQLLDAMSDRILEISESMGFPEANRDKTAMMYKLAEIIGERPTLEYEKRSLQEYVPLLESSNLLMQGMTLSDVDMKWSTDNKAWFSTGKVGLSNIMRKDINARLDGFVEVKRTQDGDIVNIFLQASPSAVYYFSFEQNRLIIFSTDEDFNSMVNSRSKADKAKFNDFAFTLGSLEDALQFVNTYRKVYLSIDEPYVINSAPTQEVPLQSSETDPAKKADPEDEDEGF
jgi:hypothetical protein